MTLETAEKVAELLKQKQDLELFLNILKPDIRLGFDFGKKLKAVGTFFLKENKHYEIIGLPFKDEIVTTKRLIKFLSFRTTRN